MKTAIVTGAGAGIGRATAERYGRKGWRVIATDVNEVTGNETVRRINDRGGSGFFRKADSSSLAEWDALADWVCSEFGIPDLVVNNAGILIGGGFLEQSGDDWRRMIQVNMMGPIWGSRTFVERMAAAGRRGHIVNVASCGAFLPTQLGPSYVTAKAGVYLGTNALRSEFGKKGIGVTVVCPGLIRTDLATNGHRAGDDESWAANLGAAQRFSWRSPERVAAAIERSVRWNLGTVPVGFEAWIIWFAYRLSPSLVRGISSKISMPLADKFTELSGRFLRGVR
ncbi:putative oxidoreductase [Gordonia effusa NBRC 100432]|uniref:Putative oxidoreductase n=1 Tax=Gordonia effusa NBRC 100432 TaxID=1077974 RepID=H0R3W7_9ACTN|nr:SDR family NAD(P)-dependent oxidoreductase [Gordonia effusa]GAB19768.1 putative oxidoreductase [Gordonia effusa NBRC 100432]